MRTLFVLLATTVLGSTAWAEPTFLAKQYTRCTACHYSPTGGGLLTPYGRLLSHRELSTTGRTASAPASGAEDDPHGEQAFLYGALGDALGPVHLGLEMRPSHLRIGFPGGHQDLNLLMNVDVTGALQKNGWTAYGTVGREPPRSAVRDGRTLPDSAFISYEHWISYQTEEGFRIRAGRFLPAYGVRFADHTTYTREYLDLDRNDQVYGFEVSHTMGPSLVQVMVSPGKAEAILHDRSHQRLLHRRPLAVRSRAARDHRRLGPLSPLDGSGSAVRRGGRRLRLRANVSRVDLDGSRRESADEGRGRILVGGGQRDVRRGVPRDLAEVLATAPHVRRGAGLVTFAPPRVRSGPAAAHALERERCVLPRSRVQRDHVDAGGTAAPVHVRRVIGVAGTWSTTNSAPRGASTVPDTGHRARAGV